MADDESREYVVLRFPKPKNIERVLWGVIVLVLVSLVFWNPFSEYGNEGQDVSAAVSVEPAAVAAPTKVPQEVKETPKVEEKVEPKKEEVKTAPSTPLGGDFVVEILDVVTERPNGAAYVKLKSVKYKINNQKQDYNLLLQVKAAASGDSAISSEKIRGESNLPLKAGKEFSSVVPVSSGTWVTPATLDVTLIVTDFDNDEILVKKKIPFPLN